MGGTEYNYPQQPSYGESMRESLQAQVDLAPELYQAEASQQYGRPAYAQLETDILRNTLLGQERFVPGEGGAEGGVYQSPATQPATTTVTRPGGDVEFTKDEDGRLAIGMGQTSYQVPNQQGQAGVHQSLGSAYMAANPDQRESMMADWRKVQSGETTPQQLIALGIPEEMAMRAAQMSGDEFAQMHYDFKGKEAGYAFPTQGEMQRGEGLLELLGGGGIQEFGTGQVEQKFLTREATEEDVAAGTARFVGQEIDEGRIRDGQMIGETRDVIGTSERQAGYSKSGDFMGLAQYGSDIAEQSARRQRAADIGDVQKFGAIASQAIRESDPLSSGLLTTMGEQATEGLDARGDLTKREEEGAIQSARRAWEARGSVRAPMAVVSELENLESAQRARAAQRRAFATQTMQASRAMTADPFMAILGRPSGASQQIASAGLGGAQYGLSASPGVVFNPEAGLNYQLGQSGNLANLEAAKMGASAQKTAGVMSGLGALGGGFLQNPSLKFSQ